MRLFPKKTKSGYTYGNNAYYPSLLTCVQKEKLSGLARTIRRLSCSIEGHSFRDQGLSYYVCIVCGSEPGKDGHVPMTTYVVRLDPESNPDPVLVKQREAHLKALKEVYSSYDEDKK